ncbi:hypothetical protein MOKP64_39610 [Mycobacterium avium subsp. hominissuis]
MNTIIIREATGADIPDLIRLTSEYVDIMYRWEERLGGGDTARDHLALVAADAAGFVCGVIGVGPPPIDTVDTVLERVPGTYDRNKVSWWKINVLAVDRIRRGEGIGRELLRETVHRMPRRHVGLFGHIVETRTDAITWYRRQGFYIGPSSGLTLTERPGDRNAIGLVPTPGEVAFRGYRSILHDHLKGKAHPQWEERTARAEYARMVGIYSTSRKASVCVGYRLYVRRVTNTADVNSCLHASMGPRPMFVFGWDPNYRRVCFDCISGHLSRIEKYDVEKLCDGCGNVHSDTRMSFATDDDRMLLVAAGLCPTCRSGRG